MNIKLASFFIMLFTFGSLQCNGSRQLIILIDWNGETVAKDLDTDHFDSMLPGFGPVTAALATALRQKTAPILVTSCVWNNFVERRKIFHNFREDKTKTYLGKYKKLDTQQKINEFREKILAYFSPNGEKIIGDYNNPHSLIKEEMNGYLICAAVTFLKKDWIIKKDSNYFYLLVPQDYLRALLKGPQPPKSPALEKTISRNELLLGLKIDHMSDMSYEDALDPSKHIVKIDKLQIKDLVHEQDYEAIRYSTHTYLDNQLIISSHFIKILPSVFITKADLIDKNHNEKKTEESKAHFLFSWHMYLLGHGSESAHEHIEKKYEAGVHSSHDFALTAGLEISDFRNFLSFLEQLINTKFLFYTTCHSGGHQLKKLYEHYWKFPALKPGDIPHRRFVQDVYTFMIVTSNIEDTLTTDSKPFVVPPFSNVSLDKIQIIYFIDFSGFFNAIQKYFNMSKVTASQKKQYFELQKDLDILRKAISISKFKLQLHNWLILYNNNDIKKLKKKTYSIRFYYTQRNYRICKRYINTPTWRSLPRN